MSLQTQNCANHPNRLGRALCMNCKKVVCQECATQWDGINYCVTCLKQRGALTHKRSALARWVALWLAIAVLLLIAPTVMVWAAALMADLF